ncbi:5-oxoprolinase [Candidatus Nitromaritima sp. SCGC AAA799-C22]|nr:5-oxoprolinase [Candidatus Nitromaritima sp. SCGC AAA799-C22]
MPDPKRFRFSIDRGGTFTDIYAEVPGYPGFRTVKLLSENPRHYPDAPREGIRRILEEVTGDPILPSALESDRIEWIRMGTTVATNALLERKGARTALVITGGFRDLLRIGKQSRPQIFDLKIKIPDPLYEAVVETDERVRLLHEDEANGVLDIVHGPDGERVAILHPPDLDRLREKLQKLLDRGVTSLAVALMHSHIFPAHELAVGRLADAIGFRHVSLSSQVMPRIKLVDRGQTCCVDAYLTPHIREYLDGFRSGFKGREPELFFMQSDGGLVEADSFSGSRAILSGPAGGVVGYAMTTYNEETKRPVIGFDMGGTSTDVSRFDGEYEWVYESEVAGVHLLVPQLDIRTVAAGGGSRLFFRNGLFVAGPESSGAFPGPVCYRNGGPLSLTDANLALGRLLPEHFPNVFGPDENQPLDLDAAHSEFSKLASEINARRDAAPLSVEEVAFGFVRVANETMARPIREVSVARGFDLKEHVLACFGGAGGQHACALARALQIDKIFIHRFAGILSAYGMGLADVVRETQEPASAVLGPGSMDALALRLDKLSDPAIREMKSTGYARIEVRRFLNLRYEGTDTALMILEPANKDFATEFRQAHQREFGFNLTGRDILVDDLRVRVIGKSGESNREPVARNLKPARPVRLSRCWFDDGWKDTQVYLQDDLGAGETIPGPALIINDTSTVLVEPGCVASVTEYGDLEIDVPPGKEAELGTEADPIQLSLFANRFMSIAEQMGRSLQRTAVSTNIKERQDFSCAVFGPEGDLIANAPHQPVHLGAMGEAVKYQSGVFANSVQPDDVWLTNHPVAGGSHLPDMTVITPVVRGGRPVFYVAGRGHHADIGGTTPGSMPPFSRTLEEEGACIESFKLVDNGYFREEEIKSLLLAPGNILRREGEPPISGTRALADNLSDLKAQIAANRKGIELLDELVDRYSLHGVQAYMEHIRNNAERSVRDLLREVSVGHGLKEKDTLDAEDFLDDGSPIRLRLMIDRSEGSAVFDFTGTGPQVPGNLNTPRAVTQSAILYCLRCMVKSDLPLNQGCLAPVRIVLPEGSLLAPTGKAAVAAGNVLTSQRITDVIFKAFGACAASQGCMNNFTFGDDRFGYYETIGGGAGAGPHWHGRSGVHTHMTNTRITDPEILEKRYPVLLREFSIREGSGGKGKFRGGDGLIREVEFLKTLRAAIVSERRVYAPYGMEGGESGAKGKNLLIRKDGTETDLGGKNEVLCEPGDRIRILTPGGGGWGGRKE